MAAAFNGGGLGGGMIHHDIPDKETLYRSYMPFVKNGGLFIPGHTKVPLGKDIFLTLTLMGSPERMAVASKVVWITPPGNQGGKTPGIGVQFGAMDHGKTRQQIESYLAGALERDTPTYTM